jgi:hypothetical protein
VAPQLPSVVDMRTHPTGDVPTTLASGPDTADQARVSWQASLAGAAAAGAALGFADLFLQLHLAYPWGGIANTSAVWVAAAAVVGLAVRGSRSVPIAALAGVVTLVVAVEAYYLAAIVVDGDNIDNLWSATTQMWLMFAVLAGAVFGAAGFLSRGASAALGILSAALVAGVLLGQAAMQGGADALFVRGAELGPSSTGVALALAALGFVLVASRHWWQVPAALILASLAFPVFYTIFEHTGLGV